MTMDSQPKWMTWTGRVISALPVLGLLFSGVMKFQEVTPEAAKGLEGIGWKESQLPGLGILEIVCTIIYALPQTAVLGAILLTGYMGGAIATHVRVGDGIIPHIIIGVLVWLGLFLREPRLRAILPWRTSPQSPLISKQ
jgi:hypothetical protein